MPAVRSEIAAAVYEENIHCCGEFASVWKWVAVKVSWMIGCRSIAAVVIV